MFALDLQAVVYWAPKDAAHPEEWEDGAAYSEGLGLFAVADGAATAYRSREWAQMLTGRYVHQPSPDTASWMTDCVEQWNSQPQPASWWEADAANGTGSAATFVGLHVSSDGEHISWTAAAIGDSCLFHVRNENVLATFPIEHPEDFTVRPALLSTVDKLARTAIDRDLHQVEGVAQPGDRFFLASDAFAETLMTHRDGVSWAGLATMGPERFRDLVSDLRANDALKPDDVTLIAVEVRTARR